MKFGLQKSISFNNLSSSYSSSSNDSEAPKLPALPFPVFRDPTSAQSSNHASISSLTSDWSMLGNSNASDSNSNGYSSSLMERASKKGSSKSTDSTKTTSSSSKSGGFDRFVKRVRSASMGASKKSMKEKVLPLPPLPYSLGVSSKGVGGLSNFDGSSTGSTPRDRKFNSIGNVGIPSNENSFDHIPPSTSRRTVPSEEEDLASLLYLVHTAGDIFSAKGRLHDSPPSSPRYSADSSSKSSSILTPAKSQKSNPLPTSSTRSYLSPHSSPLISPTLNRHLPTPPNSPLRTSTFPPSRKEDEEVASEDDYGSSAHEEEFNLVTTKSKSTWLKTSNASFAIAAVDDTIDDYDAISRSTLDSSPSRDNFFGRGKRLGPVARGLLELTVVKMDSSEKLLEGLRRPLSIKLSSELNGKRDQQEIRISLGRLLIKKKLRNGLTLLQGVELEKSKKADGSARISTLSTLTLDAEVDFSDTTNLFSSPSTTTTFDSPIFPIGMSTPSSLKAWMTRPSFVKNNLVTNAVEGGFLIDLIRPSPKSQSAISYSNRIRCWSETKLFLRSPDKVFVPLKSTVQKQGLLESRTEEKKPLLISERRGSLPSNGVPLSVKIDIKSPLTSPSRSPSIIPDNRPEFNNTPRIDDDAEEDVPLAYLRQRSSTSIPSTPQSPQLYSSYQLQNIDAHITALRKAEVKSSQLEEEVMQMRYQEQLTQDRQYKIDLKREEDERNEKISRADEENFRREERRLAEERRRGRAMGLVDEQEGGLPKISRNNDGVKISYDNCRPSSSMSNQIRGNAINYSNNDRSTNFLPSQPQVLPPMNNYGSNLWINQGYQQYPTMAPQFHYPMMPMQILLPPPQPFYAQSDISSRSAPDLQLLATQSYQNSLNPYHTLSANNYVRSPTPQYQSHRPVSPSPKIQVPVAPTSPSRLTNNKSQIPNVYRPNSSTSLQPPDSSSRRISGSSSRPQQLKPSPSSPNLSSQSIPRHYRTASGGVEFLNSAEQRLQYEKNRRIRLDEARKNEGKKETFVRL